MLSHVNRAPQFLLAMSEPQFRSGSEWDDKELNLLNFALTPVTYPMEELRVACDSSAEVMDKLKEGFGVARSVWESENLAGEYASFYDTLRNFSLPKLPRFNSSSRPATRSNNNIPNTSSPFTENRHSSPGEFNRQNQTPPSMRSSPPGPRSASIVGDMLDSSQPKSPKLTPQRSPRAQDSLQVRQLSSPGEKTPKSSHQSHDVTSRGDQTVMQSTLSSPSKTPELATPEGTGHERVSRYQIVTPRPSPVSKLQGGLSSPAQALEHAISGEPDPNTMSRFNTPHHDSQEGSPSDQSTTTHTARRPAYNEANVPPSTSTDGSYRPSQSQESPCSRKSLKVVSPAESDSLVLVSNMLSLVCRAHKDYAGINLKTHTSTRTMNMTLNNERITTKPDIIIEMTYNDEIYELLDVEVGQNVGQARNPHADIATQLKKANPTKTFGQEVAHLLFRGNLTAHLRENQEEFEVSHHSCQSVISALTSIF